jgi:LEA14-like dessication related protein
MEKMKVNIVKVWNPTEILIFEFLVQLLNNLQIPLTAHTIKRYINRLVQRAQKLGFAFHIVVKSLNDIQSRLKSHDKALKAWLNAYY